MIGTKFTVMYIGTHAECRQSFSRVESAEVKVELVQPDSPSVTAKLAMPPPRGLAVIVVEVLSASGLTLLQEVLEATGRSVPVVTLVDEATIDAARELSPHSLVLLISPESCIGEFAGEIVTYWTTHNIRPQSD